MAFKSTIAWALETLKHYSSGLRPWKVHAITCVVHIIEEVLPSPYFARKMMIAGLKSAAERDFNQRFL